MNGAEHHQLTPTQIQSIERSKAFKAKIAEAAAKLNDLKTISALEEVLPTSPPIAKNWFEIVEELGPAVEEQPSIFRIQCAVAGYFKIRRADLLSGSRMNSIVIPRQIAHFLCRELTDFSFYYIGRFMGGKDHSTIHYSCEKIRRMVRREWRLAFDVAEITKAIGGGRPQ